MKSIRISLYCIAEVGLARCSNNLDIISFGISKGY